MTFIKAKHCILFTAFLVAGTAEVYAMDTVDDVKTSISQRPAMDSQVKADLEKAGFKYGGMHNQSIHEQELKAFKAVLYDIQYAQSMDGDKRERVQKNHRYLLDMTPAQAVLLYTKVKEKIKEKEKIFSEVSEQERKEFRERNNLLQEALEKNNWELVPQEFYITMLNKKGEPIPSDLKQRAENMKAQDEARENRKKTGIEPEIKALIAEIQAATAEKK